MAERGMPPGVKDQQSSTQSGPVCMKQTSRPEEQKLDQPALKGREEWCRLIFSLPSGPFR